MRALYYPNLSLPDESWVNPTLLYFDSLLVISPMGSFADLYDPRTEALIGEGLVEPIYPQQFGGNHPGADRLLGYIHGFASRAPKNSPIARIHLGKLSYTGLARDLVETGLLRRSEGFWLEGPDWAVNHLMTYLAVMISTHADVGVPLLTSEIAAGKMLIGRVPERVGTSRRAQMLLSLLPIAPDAKPHKIAAFRANHSEELRLFRDLVEGQIRKHPEDDAGDMLFDHELQHLKEVRGRLVSELRASSLLSIASMIALGAAPVAGSLVEEGYWSAGIGGVIAAGHAVAARVRRRRVFDEAVVYAALAANKWPKEGPSPQSSRLARRR